MDLTFQIDFSPVKEYTIIPALAMMGYISTLLETDDPITIGVNDFGSFTKSDKAQLYFCLKAGPMWYMSQGKASQAMICYALFEALRNQFPSTVKPFEDYKTPEMDRYADILDSYLWLSFLDKIEQAKNNNYLERLDYLFADVSASALAHNDLRATLQVSEYRQMLHFFLDNSMKFVLQEIFKLKSSNLVLQRDFGSLCRNLAGEMTFYPKISALTGDFRDFRSLEFVDYVKISL
jgi:hypothetical protein